MKIDYTSIVLMSLALCFELGCAGARFDVIADSAKYPISFSPALPDETGAVLVLGHGLEPSGFLNIEATSFGFIYSATEGTIDISEEINRQVKSQGGEGVVMLSLVNKSCATNFLFPFMYLPFWPGCQDLTVTGRVVKTNRSKRSRAEAPISGGLTSARTDQPKEQRVNR